MKGAKDTVGEVVGLKNGMSPKSEPPDSGYRHVALLVRHTLRADVDGVTDPRDGTKLGKAPKGATMVCEVQLLLEKYLENKLTTSCSYKVRRAADWETLCKDFNKYLGR